LYTTGTWVLVLYDAKPYPGIIQNDEMDKIELETMHRILAKTDFSGQ
jgi:hypothetical protein